MPKTASASAGSFMSLSCRLGRYTLPTSTWVPGACAGSAWRLEDIKMATKSFFLFNICGGVKMLFGCHALTARQAPGVARGKDASRAMALFQTSFVSSSPDR